MLTLYIMKSHHEKKSIADIYLSLSSLWEEGMMVERVDEINEDTKNTDWFIVLFDHEKVSPDLTNAIKTILDTNPPFDVFVFMEKNKEKITQSPRMFRNFVKLQKDSFLPEDNGYRYERILDGWVKKVD